MYAGVIEGLDLHATSGVIGRRKSEKGGKEKGGKQTVQQNEERQTQKEPEMSFPPFSFPLPFLSLSLSAPKAVLRHVDVHRPASAALHPSARPSDGRRRGVSRAGMLIFFRTVFARMLRLRQSPQYLLVISQWTITVSTILRKDFHEHRAERASKLPRRRHEH